MSQLKRYFLKHRSQPDVWAIEGDDSDGAILAALDVTSDATKGGLCPHMLDALPLVANVGDLEYIARQRDDYELHVPECGNTHHLLADLLALEREHVEAVAEFAEADAVAKMKKRAAENAGSKVHAVLARMMDRKPLPLFDAAGV